MNSIEAKKIKITDYFNINFNKNEFFIKSLFNLNETTPSFKINNDLNIWYDHATGTGGNIIDLVMKLNNCSFKAALILLEEGKGNFSFSSAKQEPIKELPKKEIEILKVVSLENTELIKYLQKRKIYNNYNYIKEIYYKKDDKNFFSIAFENDLKGYETRNAYFKGCIGHKTITTIKGSENEKLSIFEGFMDFLSALEHFKINSFKGDVIILNSTANLNKIEKDIVGYKKIFCFLDNDKTGIKATNQIFQINKNSVNCSNIYKNYNDFNEFL